MSQSWFSFKNSADDKSVEISIYDAIGSYSVSAKSFIAELKRAGSKDVTLRIHSPGGSILEGNAIYNALKRHPGAVDVVIDGMAASMASVIAMAGDTIEIAENGLVMIHNPSAFGGGEAKDMRKMADVMDKMKSNIITAYAGKTGLSREKLGQMMDDETWMTAEEALENKFVDSIGEKSDAKNSFDLSAFKNSARAVDTFGAVTTPRANSMDLTQALAKITELEDAKKNWEAVKAGLEQAKKDAEAKVTGLESEKTTLTNDLKASTGKVTALEGEKVTLTNDLKAATDKVTKLEDEAKSSDQRAREIAAANGSEGTRKDPESAAAGANDGKALYEAYEALMKDRKFAEASAHMAKHQKAIDAYADGVLSKRD